MYKYNIINSNNNMVCIITYWNHVFDNLKMEFLLPSEKPCDRGRSCMICCIRIFMRLRWLDTVFQDHKCFLPFISPFSFLRCLSFGDVFARIVLVSLDVLSEGNWLVDWDCRAWQRSIIHAFNLIYITYTSPRKRPHFTLLHFMHWL